MKPKRPKIHADEVFSGDGLGYCSHPDCFAEHYGVEPDAYKYTCDECCRESVYGIEECVALEIVDVVYNDAHEYTMEAIVERNLKEV